jgi:hypothetical protein
MDLCLSIHVFFIERCQENGTIVPQARIPFLQQRQDITDRDAGRQIQLQLPRTHDVLERREKQKPHLHFGDDITRARLGFMMKACVKLLVLAAIMTSFACSGARLAHDEARQKIAELGRSDLVPDAVEIRRLAYQSDNEAIAEVSVTLAFQFKRDPGGEWKVTSVRLGDRDWVDMAEILAAIDQARQRQTAGALEKVVLGIAEYRRTNNSLPVATDIVGLTDVLHPRYMTDLVRTDAWGHPIDYEVTGPAYRLVSRGPDGVRGTADDIVLP